MSRFPAETLFTGERTTCTAQVSGTATTTTWNAPAGDPPAGSSPSFATSYNSTGTQPITVQVCNGTSCTTQSASVNVLRKPDPTTPPVARPAPVSLVGQITITEQDVDCGFTAMPAITGQINMTISPGASASDPITAIGNIQGAGSGSRSVSCASGTAQQSWSTSWGGPFNGVVDQRTGAVQLTGPITLVQSAQYTNCRDRSGKEVPCPPDPGRKQFTMTLNGSVTLTPNGPTNARGAINIPTGCTTTGNWNVG
jgi:hypothetical protein